MEKETLKSEDQLAKIQEEQKAQEKNLEVSKFRIISIGLFEAAMRYRESYYRDDLVEYEKMCHEELEKVSAKYTDRGQKRRAKERAEVVILKFKNDQERFNNTVYDHINKVTQTMPPTTQIGFDNYATGFGLIMEEFLRAKNTTHLIAIMKAYNEGLLDNVIELIKPKEDEKDKANSGGAAIITLDNVQKGGETPTIITGP